jgi:tetratricopeptide (TPR) repeat protein
MPVNPVGEPEELTKKLKDHSDDASLWAAYAESQLTHGDFEAAEKAAKQSIEIDKDQVTGLTVICHVLVGKMLSEENESERHEYISQVDPYLRRLFKLKPDSAAAIKYLGYVEQAWEQWPEAIDWLTRYQKRFPDDPDSYRRLAGIFLQQEKVDAALQQLERLFQLEDDEAPVARQIGRIYMDKKQPAVAARWFRRAIDIDPYDVDTHGALADAWLHAGNHAGAEREYQVVVRILPEEAIGYDGLAAVYKAMGNKEKADEFAARAAALGAKRPAKADHEE